MLRKWVLPLISRLKISSRGWKRGITRPCCVRVVLLVESERKMANCFCVPWVEVDGRQKRITSKWGVGYDA